MSDAELYEKLLVSLQRELIEIDRKIEQARVHEADLLARRAEVVEGISGITKMKGRIE